MSSANDLAIRRAALARASRTATRNPDDEAARALDQQRRRDYYEAKIAQHVADLVAKAPPLTDDQCDRLALLFKSARPRTSDVLTVAA